MMLKRIKLATLGLVAASAILPVASPARAAFSKTSQESVIEIQGEVAKQELIAHRRRRHRHHRRRRRRVRYRRYRRPRYIRRRRCYRTRRYRTRNGYSYKTVCRYRNYRRYRY